MADPTALPPSLLEKVLDPNNLVAVVTVGLLYMLWTFTNKRFDLERQEQDELVGRIDELQEDLLKLEGQIDALRKQVNERG
jgi:nitrogen fixation-related uncharacterized protein